MRNIIFQAYEMFSLVADDVCFVLFFYYFFELDYIDRPVSKKIRKDLCVD